MIAITIMAATTPIMAAMLPEELWGLVDVVLFVGLVVLGELWGLEVVLSVVHSSSLRDEIATGHSESTDIGVPVTKMLILPLTHCSIRDMSELLSAS